MIVETIKRIVTVKEDLEAAGNIQTDIDNRNAFKQKVFDRKIGQREVPKTRRVAWMKENKFTQK